MKVAVLGPSGFVGRAAIRHLVGAGHDVVAVGRSRPSEYQAGIEWRAIGPFENVTDWRAPLAGCDSLLYLAARVHVMRDTAADPLADYKAVNTTAALRAAEAAEQVGVRRFVYVSSIKVNGERTVPGVPFVEASLPAPIDPYGFSKLEAERALGEIAARTQMEVVVLRPPLLYGPGAKGNFPKLARLARLASHTPLPIASVRNRRSLLYLEHFADALRRIVEHPDRLAPLFLIADPEPVSTPDLLRAVGAALGLRPRFLPCPPGALMALARITGFGPVAARLLDSLEVNATALRHAVRWESPTPLAEAIRRSFSTARSLT